MALKLYGLPMSAYTTRVMICLNEKGLDFELLPVDLFNRENKQPHFLAKNVSLKKLPFGQAPVLEDGELTLFESRAIIAYLTEKHKDSGCDLMRHKDLNEYAMVKVWSEVEAHQYNPAISLIVYQHLVAPLLGKATDEAVINASLERLEKVLDVYEARLSHTEYLAGDFYSAADLHHLPYTFYFMRTPWASLVNDRPHVKAWWGRISSRPAFQKVAVGMSFGEKS